MVETRRMVRKRMKYEGRNMPADIIFEILARLPVKSLLRFKSVCKYWCSLIQDQTFINRHLQQSSQSNRIIAVVRDFLIWEKRTYRYGMINARFFSISKDSKLTTKPFSDYLQQRYYISYIASCNGLLCVLGAEGYIHVVNLATQETMDIETPEFLRYGLIRNVIGLGFDRTTNKYKVVGWEINSNDSKVVIFTLGSKSWREIRSPPRVVIGNRTTVPVYVDGAAHWYVNKEILAFNFAGENFSIIPAPQNMDSRPCRMLDLGGRLCLVEDVVRDSIVTMWVLANYDRQEWTKQQISLPFGAVYRYVVPLRDGEILIRIVTGEWREPPKLIVCRYNEKGEVIETSAVRGSGLRCPSVGSLHCCHNFSTGSVVSLASLSL